METSVEHKTLVKKLTNDAKAAVLDWFERRDLCRIHRIEDLYVTWIAKVDKHFKAHVEFRNCSHQEDANLAFDVDLYEDGERVITAYEILGVTVYDVNETWKKPQLTGFDDSLI